jgi:hypothetical protein
VADRGRPGERHRADPPIRRQSGTHVRSTSHQLYGGLRRTGLQQGRTDEMHEPQRRERRLRRRLHDHRAAGRERRRDLVRCQQQRIVESGDPDHDADRLAHPEPDQPVATRQQVQRHRLTMQPGDLLSRGLQSQQRSIDLDPAIDHRLAGLKHEQVDERVPLGRDRRMHALQDLPPYVRRKPTDRLADGECVVEGLLGQGHVSDRSVRHRRPVVREDHWLGGRRLDPGLSDR